MERLAEGGSSISKVVSVAGQGPGATNELASQSPERKEGDPLENMDQAIQGRNQTTTA